MKVKVIPVIIDDLGTILKGLVKEVKDLEFRGEEKTIETTALLGSSRILKIPGDLKGLAVAQIPQKRLSEEKRRPSKLQQY